VLPLQASVYRGGRPPTACYSIAARTKTGFKASVTVKKQSIKTQKIQFKQHSRYTVISAILLVEHFLITSLASLIPCSLASLFPVHHRLSFTICRSSLLLHSPDSISIYSINHYSLLRLLLPTRLHLIDSNPEFQFSCQSVFFLRVLFVIFIARQHAMHAERDMAFSRATYYITRSMPSCGVCLSLLSHAGILSKQLNLS